MRRLGPWGLLALGVAGGALALTAGDKVYVRARDTQVLKKASPTADTVAKLQPGDVVVWRGADKDQPQWHRVDVQGQVGFVWFSNLSAKPPDKELLTAPKGSRPVDPQAFASSGAAGKALTEGAIRYGTQDEKNKGDLKPSMHDAVRQTLTVEAIAQQRSVAELQSQAARVQGGTP
ncbi:MAG TPA: SH3 domain-containing protein [Myxococcaceae bacterium]|jgi:hypothetical protein|nr:SH3 domain-containing protein [Myxococcaceae bacterium]